MDCKPVCLARLHVSDRVVVALLRGGGLAASQDLELVFAKLRVLAVAEGLVLHDAGRTVVSADELILLAWLASLQRRRSEFVARYPQSMAPALREGADALAGAGYRLSMGCQLRGRLESIVLPSRPIRPAASDRHRLRARALEEITRRGQVSTREFADIGISRQMVWRMHQEGKIRRLAMGLYSLP